jgi:hypothetical protein
MSARIAKTPSDEKWEFADAGGGARRLPDASES